MPQSNDDLTIEQLQKDPVIGDGVVTLPPEKEKKMAFDLPEGMASMLASETAGNIQATNTNSREVFRQAAGVLSAVCPGAGQLWLLQRATPVAAVRHRRAAVSGAGSVRPRHRFAGTKPGAGR